MEEAPAVPAFNVIAADKIKGSDVFNTVGDKLGTIDAVMLDRATGKALYAVLSFGGFLGLGEKHYPLPWSLLTFNEEKDGYTVNLDRQQLEGGPNYDRSAEFNWSADYGRKIDAYYGARSYWA